MLRQNTEESDTSALRKGLAYSMHMTREQRFAHIMSRVLVLNSSASIPKYMHTFCSNNYMPSLLNTLPYSKRFAPETPPSSALDI